MARMLIGSMAAVSALAIGSSAPAVASEPEPTLRAAAAPEATLGKEVATPVRTYVIEARLIATAPDEPLRVLSEPTVATVEGRKAVLRIGGGVTPPDGAEAIGEPFAGLTFSAEVSRTEDGRILLDASLLKSWTPADAPHGSVRLVNIGTRIIEAVTLGERIVVPVQPGDEGTSSLYFELVVSEARDKTAANVLGEPTRR